MILKSFIIEKNIEILEKYKLSLIYGENEGIKTNLKNIIKSKNKDVETITIFQEELIKDNKILLKELSNTSLFSAKKIIFLHEATDKIFKQIVESADLLNEDLKIFVFCQILDKKSKIRNFFEKEKNTICVPFYEDNHQTLAKIVQNFLKEKNLRLSQQNINIIVERSRGDRINLNNELIKIENYLKNKKNISENEILKITNLAENYQIGELVDNSLAKNKSRTLTILNENNFNTEDCILILRIFLSKLKRLLKIKTQQQKDKNLDNIISSFRPPIFWKEKEIVKQQIKKLEYDKIKELIIKTNNIEFLIKKNPTSSIFIVSDFILENAIEN